MKLVCLTGSYHHKVYDIYPPGISLGREDDNDVVVSDNEASRYHAKIEMFENVWYVHDVNSSNGVLLNRKKIDKSAPLSLNDEIQIGTTIYRFTDESGVAEASAPGGAAPPLSDEATRSETSTRPKPRLALVALIALLLLLVLLVVVALLMPSKPKQPAEAGVTPPPSPLQVYYEKVSVNSDRMFRYEMKVVDHRLQVEVDDVHNGNSVEEHKDLSPEQEDQLRKALLIDSFLTAEAPVPDERKDVLERERLLVRSGNRGNYVVVENAVPPEAVNRVVGELTDYVRRELGVFAEPLPREEVIKLAKEQYDLAQRLQEDMTIDPGNLYKSIEAYRQVIERLKGIENRPAFHDEAVKKLREAEAALDKLVDKLQRDAIMFRNLDQLVKAKECYEKIINHIPAPTDPRVLDANREVIRLEDAMIKKRKGKR